MDQFMFTTRTTVDSAVNWGGTAGDNYIDVGGGGTGDITRRWTGAEIVITEATSGNGPALPLHFRITRVGEATSYTLDRIYIDDLLPETFTLANVKVFRREYVPRSGNPFKWCSQRLMGKVRFRDRPEVYFGGTRPTLRHISKIQYQYSHGDAVESGAQTPELFTMSQSRLINAPKFAPVIDGIDALGSKTTAAGTYYLAFAWEDKDAGVISPLGPMLEYEASAANLRINVEYGTEDSQPDQSYTLALYVSEVDPVGFDENEIIKDSRKRERMITFYRVDEHPFDTSNGAGSGGGLFAPVALDEDIPTFNRYYPTDRSLAIFLRELPDDDMMFVVDGKIKMPWFTQLYDEPPLPDDFLEILNAAISMDIAASNGSQSTTSLRAQYEFLLQKLRRADVKRAGTGEVDPRWFGDRRIKTDRYDIY